MLGKHGKSGNDIGKLGRNWPAVLVMRCSKVMRWRQVWRRSRRCSMRQGCAVQKTFGFAKEIHKLKCSGGSSCCVRGSGVDAGQLRFEESPDLVVIVFFFGFA